MHSTQRFATGHRGLRVVTAILPVTAIMTAAFALMVAWSMPASAQAIDRFVGKYSGTVDVVIEGVATQRDASVDIQADAPGFVVNWDTVTRRSDGSVKSKSYTVNFQPTDRDGVFGAAMRRNVFGKEVPLDPMKGEPYVWSRIVGDTLTVFSIYVYNDGSYEIQQFDRTLVDGGLKLEFSTAKNGEVHRQISAFLQRE